MKHKINTRRPKIWDQDFSKDLKTDDGNKFIKIFKRSSTNDSDKLLQVFAISDTLTDNQKYDYLEKNCGVNGDMFSLGSATKEEAWLCLVIAEQNRLVNNLAHKAPGKKLLDPERT